jgi:hypothetical protein
MKTWHLLLCAGLIVAGIALLAAGVKAAVLLPALGCVVMMGAMMVMMGRSGGGDGH